MATDLSGLYETSDGTPTLRDSIVLYVDELGTSEALKGLSDADLQGVLSDHADLGWFLHSPDVELAQRSVRFSDNTVVGAPVTGVPAGDPFGVHDGGAFSQVFSAAAYQCNLAIRGRFLRGAVARGPLYIGDSYVTGLGLLLAVKMEENEATFPRVLVHRDLWLDLLRDTMPDADPFNAPQNRYILVDGDGELFVNYLAVLAEDDGLDDIDNVEIGLVKHRDIVEALLAQYKNVERVRRKYVWVAQYHDWVCSEAFYNRPDLAVTSGLTDFESVYDRPIRLLIEQPGILAGQDGRTGGLPLPTSPCTA